MHMPSIRSIARMAIVGDSWRLIVGDSINFCLTGPCLFLSITFYVISGLGSPMLMACRQLVVQAAMIYWIQCSICYVSIFEVACALVIRASQNDGHEASAQQGTVHDTNQQSRQRLHLASWIDSPHLLLVYSLLIHQPRRHLILASIALASRSVLGSACYRAPMPAVRYAALETTLWLSWSASYCVCMSEAVRTCDPG